MERPVPAEPRSPRAVVGSYPTPLGIRAPNRRTARAISIGLASALFLAGALAAAAAGNAIPGDLSYGLKLGAEQIRMMVSLSPESDLQLHLDHASSRAGELTQLVARGRPERIQAAAEDYVQAVEQATVSLDAVAAAGQPDTEDQAAFFNAKLLGNLSLLEGLRGLVPDSSAEGLAGAITATHRGLDRSADLLNRLPKP
jgi:hypothetical protein